MKYLATCLPIAFALLLQCTPSTHQESTSNKDSVAAIPATVPTSDKSEIAEGANNGSIDIEYLTKYPFESDHAKLKNDLVEAGFVVKDTILYGHVVLLFDSSRVEINDADDNQDVIGDLICSANIRSSEFAFSQAVSIGMSLDDFLSRASLTKAALKEDPTSARSYFQNEIPFNDGHWMITLWFTGGLLTEIEYEISPCEIEYDH